MSLIHNERIKLLANVLNGAATSSFAVGVLAPIAAAFYSAGGTPSVSLPTVAIGAVIWLFPSRGATFRGEARARRIERMNGYELFAFVILPVSIGIAAWLIVLMNERWQKHHGP